MALRPLLQDSAKIEVHRRSKRMKPEAQKLAICKACPSVARMNEEGDWVWAKYQVRKFFEPLNDLNAMHSAEAILTPAQQDTYRDYLAVATTVHRLPKTMGQAEEYCRENEWAYCHATASQRAEAFLRTKGLWKEDEP